MTTILRITDDSTTDDIAAALAEMLHAAQRETPVHRRSELHDELTPWDHRHLGLDMLLDDWQRVQGKG